MVQPPINSAASMSDNIELFLSEDTDSKKISLTFLYNSWGVSFFSLWLTRFWCCDSFADAFLVADLAHSPFCKGLESNERKGKQGGD